MIKSPFREKIGWVEKQYLLLRFVSIFSERKKKKINQNQFLKSLEC